MVLVWLSVLFALIALIFAGYLFLKIKKEDEGTEKMKEIASSIRKGAMVFLIREYKALTVFVIIVSMLLGIFIHLLVAASYIAGSITAALAGFIGMKAATMANVRTTNAARTSYSRALRISFSGGSVMGFTVVGLGLLGLITIFLSLYPLAGTELIANEILIGYGFGASSIALFLRVGGGIFTKSADIGADLVGKVEKNIPEDDPRNPAVIADNVGDNVGDIAGMGSDLFESYVSSILAAMIIGFIAFGQSGLIFPIFLAAAGIIISIIGSLFVRSGESKTNFSQQTENAKKALNKGTIIALVLMVIFSYPITLYILNNVLVFYALLSGLVVGYLIGKTTEYYTSFEKSPTLSIAESSKTGPATNIITGLSVGMMSTALPVIFVSIAIIVSFYFAGLFGIAIASVGILATLGMIMSIDAYGPIVDNAAGIAEMAGLPKNVRESTEALDSVGNTTAAIGKGFAISSAALSSLAWLATFFAVAELKVISITDPSVIAGLFIGGMLSFVFASLAMRSVSAGSSEIINEVRRQFKEIKGLMQGKAKPDYERCIDITTKRSIREMILPGILVIIVPIIIGFSLGLASLGGFLIGTLVTGFILALMMANSGGAWDNAKKYIEAGNLGGKGSEQHKAAVVGDTVGDPFKDTSGPALNILIKLIGKVALIITPIILALAAI